MFLKKQWHRVVVEVKHENLVSQVDIRVKFSDESEPFVREIMGCVCSYRGWTSCAIGGKVRESSLESG